MPAVSIRRKFWSSTVRYVSIASRVVPGIGRNDHALFAEDLIQQRRLPDIRTADDGKLDLALRLHLDKLVEIQHIEYLVEQVADTRAVLRGDRRHLKPELIEFLGVVLDRARFGLVGGDEYRLARIPEQDGQLFIERDGPAARVQHPDYGLRLGDRLRSLFEDIGGNYGLVVRHDTAGINQPKRPGLPVDLAVDTVAGNARLIADDRFTRSGQAIEQGRFADIRTAYNCYKGRFHLFRG